MNILLLGDSITAGLGSKRINFTELLNNMLNNSNIINFAKTGTTIKYVVDNLKIIDNYDYDCVVLLYGSVDAQIRPNRTGKVFKHLPKRFRGHNGSMLSPRPFYSKNLLKCLFQKIDNIFRKFYRNLVIKIDGTEQWVKIEEFEKKYRYVCRHFLNKNKRVICCSCFYIDEKYFKGTNYQYVKYNDCIRRITFDNQIEYIDFYNIFKNLVEKEGWSKKFNYDHFHPNSVGYEMIANILADVIKSYNN